MTYALLKVFYKHAHIQTPDAHPSAPRSPQPSKRSKVSGLLVPVGLWTALVTEESERDQGEDKSPSHQ